MNIVTSNIVFLTFGILTF